MYSSSTVRVVLIVPYCCTAVLIMQYTRLQQLLIYTVPGSILPVSKLRILMYTASTSHSMGPTNGKHLIWVSLRSSNNLEYRLLYRI